MSKNKQSPVPPPPAKPVSKAEDSTPAPAPAPENTLQSDLDGVKSQVERAAQLIDSEEYTALSDEQKQLVLRQQVLLDELHGVLEARVAGAAKK